MAVPSSGTLRLAGLAAEKDTQEDYDDYDYDDVLSLKDLTVGGNANGNHFSVDVTNVNSVSHPDNSAPYKMSEFYSYDHDAAGMSLSSHQPQVFRYFSTPSPNYGQTISTGSALGTVAIFPNSSQSFTGTSTKRGDYTRTASSINNTALNLDISNETNNSWVIPDGLYNGFQYGITYYSTMWAYASHSNLTVLSGTTEWAFTAAPTVTTQAASSISGGFTMNGNLTGLGLGSSPASGAVHRVVKRGFVYSTSQSTPTYFNATIAENGASPGVFNTGSYAMNVSTTTSGTYYIRAFAYSEDKNTGPVAFHKFYAYGGVTTFTIADSRTAFLTSISMPRPSGTCYQEEDLSNKYYSDSSPGIGDTVYTSSTGSGTLSAGHYGYCNNSLTTNRSITVNSSGVITAHSNCAIP